MTQSQMIDKMCTDYKGANYATSATFRSTMYELCKQYDAAIANPLLTARSIKDKIVAAVDNWKLTHHVELSAAKVYYCDSSVRQSTPIISSKATNAVEMLAKDDVCKAWAKSNAGGTKSMFDPGCGTCATSTVEAIIEDQCSRVLMGSHPCYDVDSW